MATGPGIDDFDKELRRFVAVEQVRSHAGCTASGEICGFEFVAQEVAGIRPVQAIAALALNSHTLKMQLRTACRAWKVRGRGDICVHD